VRVPLVDGARRELIELAATVNAAGRRRECGRPPP
jgi:hypothetical protein